MRLLLDLIQTPIYLFTDPLGAIEQYPLNVIIWLGVAVWAVVRHRRSKRLKAARPDEDNIKKLY
jgi:hypothetical protein